MTEQQLLDSMENPDEFSRLITTNEALLYTAKQFPQHAETLIQKILNDPKEFSRLITCNYSLRETAKQFPQHAETLIQKILNDPKEFSRLITTNEALLYTAKQFPQHAETLIQKILNDPKEFSRLIQHSLSLLATATQFPQHAETLIQNVLNNPNEFSRLIKTNGDLIYMFNYTVKKFPQYSKIVDKPTVAEALTAVMQMGAERSRKEIEKNVIVLYGLFKFERLFLRLPSDLIIYIAAMTATKMYHRYEKARDIAYRKSEPSAAILLKYHGLLNGPSKEEISAREQSKHDKQWSST